jgi:hypothetical protein
MFRVQLISCMDGCAAHHGVQGARNLLSAVTDIDLMKRKAAAVRVIQGQISQRGQGVRYGAYDASLLMVAPTPPASAGVRVYFPFEGAATATGAKRRVRRAAEDKPMID